ncbi:MAG: hypothetical protein ACE5FZ_06335 [Nitrospiria bacterium]
MDGLKVLKEIKASGQRQHLPVVIFTSSESERDIQLAYLYGTHRYLIKSVGSDDFLR